MQSGGRRLANSIVEFDERGLAMLTFLPTWEGDNFRRVTISALGKLESDATRELSVVWSVVPAVGSSASAVAVNGGLTFLPRRMYNTWTVGPRRDWLSTQSLICVYWRCVFRKWCHRCSVAWTLFPDEEEFILNSSSKFWSRQNTVIGWCRVSVCAGLVSQMACECHLCLRSLPILWVSGHSSCFTLWEWAEELIAIA